MSSDVNRRLRDHQSALITGKHKNPLLQNAYNQHKSIFCEVLEYTQEEMPEREKFYIKKYDSKKNGYNRTTGGQGGDTYQFQTQEQRDERNRKISETISRIQKGVRSPAQSKAMMGDKNPYYRKDIDDEKLYELRQSGLGWRTIGKMVGMSHSGVKNRVIKYGENK